jgi:hypothetical protein
VEAEGSYGRAGKATAAVAARRRRGPPAKSGSDWGFGMGGEERAGGRGSSWLGLAARTTLPTQQ